MSSAPENLVTDLLPRRWCIVRTRGPNTLPLVQMLTASRFDVWTPVKTLSRPATRRKPRTEHDFPILPGLAFVAASQVVMLSYVSTSVNDYHRGFSIYYHDGRIPLIGDRTLDGLRDEERAAADRIQAERDAITREQRRQERANALQTEQARRKFLRSQRREFRRGAAVVVTDVPALAGLPGVIVKSNGTSAVVSFGGMLEWTIEAWQLTPHDVPVDVVSARTGIVA